VHGSEGARGLDELDQFRPIRLSPLIPVGTSVSRAEGEGLTKPVKVQHRGGRGRRGVRGKRRKLELRGSERWGGRKRRTGIDRKPGQDSQDMPITSPSPLTANATR
jgi:hypothetical protein